MKKAEKSSKKIQKKIKSVTVVTFWPYPPLYFQPKSKCILNNSEWLETHFKHVFEKCNEDRSWPPPNVKNVTLFFFLKASLSLTFDTWAGADGWDWRFEHEQTRLCGDVEHENNPGIGNNVHSAEWAGNGWWSVRWPLSSLLISWLHHSHNQGDV